MLRHPVFILACLLCLFSAPSHAFETSVVLDINRSESPVTQGENQWILEPESFSLSLNTSFQNGLAATAGAWQGEDKGQVGKRLVNAKIENQGGFIGAGYAYESWYGSITGSRQSSENTFRDRQVDARAFQKETLKELLVNLSYSQDIGNWTLSPELALGWQESEIDAQLSITARDTFQLDKVAEQSESKFWQLGLVVSYWKGGEESFAWQPYAAIYWQNAYEGELRQVHHHTRAIRGLSRSGSRESTAETADSASGVYDIGLSFYWNNLSTTPYYSRTFDADTNTRSFGISMAYHF